ncbi:MAG: TolC family protein [Candidatus Gastranaerophilales bacterium]|nr:TolC family protein [Candidatus Gastranaerophilales bacterium]
MVNLLRARIEQGEKLTLEECIELAIENNPNIQAARSTAKTYDGKIGQAKSDYMPQVNLSSGYDRSKQQVNTLDSYQNSVSLNQLIYDFGKTSTFVKIQKLGQEASNTNIDDVVNNIVYEVKSSYYKVLYTLKTKEVYAQSVEQYEEQLKQANAFYEEGLKPKIDVITAEVNLSNAKFNYIKSENEVSNAYADLNYTIGLQETLSYQLADNLDFGNYDMALNDALKVAYEGRPDLKGEITKETIALESVKLAKKDYYPRLNASSGYGLGGRDFPLDSSWSVGASITLPVFNGLLTHNKVKEAKANLEVAQSNLEILKLNIFKDVQKAHIAFTEARKRIPVAEKTVEQAKEGYEMASGRYEVGIGNSIEVKDAEVTYSNAKLTYYETLYDYNVAKSNLEKVIGRK